MPTMSAGATTSLRGSCSSWPLTRGHLPALPSKGWRVSHVAPSPERPERQPAPRPDFWEIGLISQDSPMLPVEVQNEFTSLNLCVAYRALVKRFDPVAASKFLDSFSHNACGSRLFNSASTL